MSFKVLGCMERVLHLEVNDANVKVLSEAGLKDRFLQMQLDQESSKLTTFQTPWGRYRYLRMPFGISPAPECFQWKLDQNLEGLEGIYKVADDILITGRGTTKDEAVKNHDANLLKLLERCRVRNLKLNREKLQLKCTETPFIGHVLTPEGIKPERAQLFIAGADGSIKTDVSSNYTNMWLWRHSLIIVKPWMPLIVPEIICLRPIVFRLKCQQD